MNKASFTVFTLFVASISLAQAPYIPEKVLGDQYASDWTYLRNDGQVFDLGGNAREDVHCMSVGTNPTIYGLPEARWAYCFGKYLPDSIGPDSVFRVDQFFVGDGIQEVEPLFWDEIGGHYNFYQEHTPEGVTGVGGAKRIIYQELYSKIDVHLLSNQSGPQMLIVIKPGGDPNDILLQFEGQDSLVDMNQVLRVWFKNKFIDLPQGLAFQQTGSTVNFVPWYATYSNASGSPQVSLGLGSYDPSKPLILRITPLVGAAAPPSAGPNPEWGTYVDGPADDAILDLDHDDDGYTYYVGYARAQVGLSISAGAFAYAAGSDMIIGSINEFYEAEVQDTWMTYLGNNHDQWGRAISYDPVFERVAVAGEANSAWTNHIQLAGNPNSFQGNGRVLVTFLDPANGQPEYLTTMHFNAIVVDIDHDASGNLYLVGHGNVSATTMALQDMPGTLDYYTQGGNFGSREGFITRLDALANLTWSTLFGGPGDDWISACHVSPLNQRLYVVGQTGTPGIIQQPWQSNTGWQGFPIVDGGGWFQYGLNDGANVFQNRNDGYLAAFELSTHGLVSCSFIGGSGSDENVTDVTSNSNGDVYLTGYTNTATYNTLACAWDTTQFGFPYCNNGFHQATQGGGHDNFILRMDPSLDLTMSSFIGADGDEVLSAVGRPRITCDDDDNVFLYAVTQSGSVVFPGTSPVPMSGGTDFYLQTGHGDAFSTSPFQPQDAYVVGFTPGNSRFYSSYVGGLGEEGSGGLDAFDGRLYVSGHTRSPVSFPTHCPTIPGKMPYCDTTPSIAGSDGDAFMAQLQYTGISIGVEELQNGSQQVLVFPNPANDLISVECEDGCLNKRITVYDALGKLLLQQRASSYVHQFPIGSLAAGNYTVMVRDSMGRVAYGRFIKP